MGKKVKEESVEPVEDIAEPEVVVEEEETSIEDELREGLIKAQTEVKSHQEQYLRTLADMENLRKRTQREKEELAKFANENILREILPVLDNLERAVEHAGQAEDTDGLLEGVQMTLTQFNQVLNRFGVEPVEALGLPFDPALHQAMGQMETTEHPANCVAQQMQKGYQLNERLLRPAMVMIAKEPVVQEQQENESTPDTDEN